MTAKPLASVNMITYNHAPYIRRAVDGVLSQKTNFPFELVIGEDCSTDGTREIVFDYQRRYPEIVRVVTSEQNVGMHRNGARTQQACRGEFVAYCEGDDYWHEPTKLQKQVGYLQSHPEYVLVHSNYDLYYVDTGRRVRSASFYRKDWDDANAYAEILTGDRGVHTLTALARKSAVDAALQNNPECSDPRFLLGDLQLWLELSRQGKVKYLAESFGTYNLLAESASRSRTPRKNLLFALSVRELVYHYVKKYDCPPGVARAAKRRVTFIALTNAWEAEDSALAAELYAEHRSLRRFASPHATLLYLGSRSRLAHALSVPVIKLYPSCRALLDATLGPGKNPHSLVENLTEGKKVCGPAGGGRGLHDEEESCHYQRG